MTSVAVVAHQGKSFDGGLDELRTRADRLRHRRSAVVRGAEESQGTRSGPRSGREGRGPDLRLGWRRHGAALRRRARRPAASRSPSSPPVRPTCWPPTSASRSRLAQSVEVGLTGSPARARRRGHQRRALRGHGRGRLRCLDDQGRRRRPEGQGRAARLRLDRAPATSAPTRSRPASRSTGGTWFKGRASCVLVGNVGTISGGFTAFADAEPDDGQLDVGVVTAKGALQWSRVLARLATGKLDRSPFTRDTSARKIERQVRPQGHLRARRRRRTQDQATEGPHRAVRDHGLPFPTRARDEHRHRRPRDLGADRRRRAPNPSFAPAVVRLLEDAFLRMRFADGFSHARSLAFMTSLVLVQGTIVDRRRRRARSATPGSREASSAPSRTRSLDRPVRCSPTAVNHAHATGISGRYLALALGLVGTLVAATTAMGQLERGLNRIYGVEQDRPTVHKYGLAFLLAVTVGRAHQRRLRGHRLRLRSRRRAPQPGAQPGLDHRAVAARVSCCSWRPRPCSSSGARVVDQPGWSWLAFGSAVSVLLWFAVTAGHRSGVPR